MSEQTVADPLASLSEILRGIVVSLADLLPCSQAAIEVVPPDGGIYILSCSFDPPSGSETCEATERSHRREILLSNPSTSFLIGQLKFWIGVLPERLIARTGDGELLIGPLKTPEPTLGRFYAVRNDQQTPFTAEDLSRASAAASWVSSIVALDAEAIASFGRWQDYVIGLTSDGWMLREEAEELRRITAISDLVSGVAHELLNPVQGILGISQNLTAKHLGDQRTRRQLDLVCRESRRCRDIVDALLLFGRRVTSQGGPANVSEVIHSVADLLHYRIREYEVEICLDLQPSLPSVTLDAKSLTQVVYNLVMNAAQAIRKTQRRGEIRIVTRADRGVIRFEVSDNGPGIPEDIRHRVFEPFFTTKAVGEGTGLGLSLCWGIVIRAGGKIFLNTNVPAGATFVVELPTVGTGNLREESLSSLDRTQILSGMRVMIIEDDDTINEWLSEELEEMGCIVNRATRGEEALPKVTSDCYDIIIMDLRLPTQSGEEFYEELRASNPEVGDRVVFITADIARSTTIGFLENSGRPYLLKPFEFDELLSILVQSMEETKRKHR